MNKLMRRTAAVLAALALSAGAAACGDDSDADAGDDPPPATDDSGTGGGLQLADPVKLVIPVGLKGQDPSATADAQDGAQLAVDELNAAGGLGGHPVEVEFIQTPTNPQEGLSSFDLAYEKDPTFLIGGLDSNTMIAAQDRIAEHGVPFLYLATSSDLDKGESGTDWSFRIRSSSAGLTQGVVDYLEENDVESVSLMYMAGVFGEGAMDTLKPLLEDAGIDVAADRSHEQDVTDLTADVLASADADAVVFWGYPNDLALFVKQMADNGLSDLPFVTNGSAPFLHTYDLVPTELLPNVTYVDDCLPVVDAHAADWAAAYESEYGYAPTSTGAQMYDAVMVAAEAVRLAGSAEPDALRDAMAELEYEGVCEDYVLDPETNGLAGAGSVYGFGADGSPIVAE